MKICILSTFPAYGKVGVNQNIFGVKGVGGLEREKGNACYKSRVFCISPVIAIISAVTSTTNQN